MNRGLEMNRKEYIYYSFMKDIVSDGYISLDESGLIMILEERLGLSDDQMDEIMGMIEDGEEPSKEDLENLSVDQTEHDIELDIYERVLKEACADEDIHEDELKALDQLANIMDISKEERKRIYDDVQEGSGLFERMRNALSIQ